METLLSKPTEAVLSVLLANVNQIHVVHLTKHVQTVMPVNTKAQQIRHRAKPVLQGTPPPHQVKPAAPSVQLADGKTNWVNPAAMHVVQVRTKNKPGKAAANTAFLGNIVQEKPPTAHYVMLADTKTSRVNPAAKTVVKGSTAPSILRHMLDVAHILGEQIVKPPPLS